MTQNAGDRKYGHGDQVTVKNATGSALDSGVPVEVTGWDGTHPEVAAVGTAGDADAVLADPVADGAYGEAVMHGLVWAKVSGSPGVGTNVDENTSDFASGGTTYKVVAPVVSDPETGNDIALIRFEGK